MKKRGSKTRDLKIKPVGVHKRFTAALLRKTRGDGRVALTEDEADAIVWLRRRNQKDYSLEQVKRRLGHGLERPVQK